jgi:hypothetical protein
MSTKELIRAELETHRDEDLDELYQVIRRFAEAKAAPPRKPGVLSKIKKIKIRAPEDFAANLDLYLSGEKPLGDDQDVRLHAFCDRVDQ